VPWVTSWLTIRFQAKKSGKLPACRTRGVCSQLAKFSGVSFQLAKFSGVSFQLAKFSGVSFQLAKSMSRHVSCVFWVWIVSYCGRSHAATKPTSFTSRFLG
jgi:uncharacterized protein YjbI with pentapeptide repeats